MFEAVESMLGEHAELEARLAEPETHADARLAKRLNRRYAELSAVIRTWREWQRLGEDAGAARELAVEDPAFGEEALELDARREEAASPAWATARPQSCNAQRSPHRTGT